MVYISEKERACNQYKELLKIIYIIGNKVILQSQFLEIARLFNLIKTDYEANKIIKELEELQLIKKEQFLDTKYKVLILRKYPIKFLENKESSYEVAAVPQNSTERAVTSVIRASNFIEHSKLLVEHPSFCLDFCIKKVKGSGSTYLYKKNEGLEYLNFISKSNLYNVDNKIHKLTKEKRDEAIINRKKGQNKRLHKGSKGKLYSEYKINLEDKIESTINYKDIRTRIEKELDKTTVDTLLNSNIYVIGFTNKDGIITVNAEIYDINNTQNINKIIEKILKLCYVYRIILKDKCKFNIKLCVENEVAKERILNTLSHKENNGKMYIENKLNSYRRATATRDLITLELQLDMSDIKINIAESILSSYIY